MQERLLAFARSYSHMGVDFERLNEPDIMRAIWRHLLPGVLFQRRRVESLQRLRIDPDPARLLDGVTDSARAAVVAATT